MLYFPFNKYLTWQISALQGIFEFILEHVYDMEEIHFDNLRILGVSSASDVTINDGTKHIDFSHDANSQVSHYI